MVRAPARQKRVYSNRRPGCEPPFFISESFATMLRATHPITVTKHRKSKQIQQSYACSILVADNRNNCLRSLFFRSCRAREPYSFSDQSAIGKRQQSSDRPARVDKSGSVKVRSDQERYFAPAAAAVSPASAFVITPKILSRSLTSWRACSAPGVV